MIDSIERPALADVGLPTDQPATEVLIGTAAFLSLEHEWRALRDASETQNPFLSWEWISTWVRHFCRDRLRTVVVRKGGELISIAPFYLNRYIIGPGLYANALQLMGPKEVQHLFEIREALIRPGWEGPAINAFVAAAASLGEWDWIELSAQGEGLNALRDVLAASANAGYRIESDPEIPIPLLRLEKTWDEQRLKFKRNIKESIRHCYNALRRDGHEHRFYRDAAGSDTAEAISRLVRLHHQRSLVSDRMWHRDHFADTEIRSFETEALSSMHGAGLARIAELSIHADVVAARACLESNGTSYLYYSGFDPKWWKYSVMTLLVTEIMRDAITRGLDTINFSPGADTSKLRWGVSLVPMQVMRLVRGNRAARARYQLVRVRKKIRQPLHRHLDRVLDRFRQRESLTTAQE